MTESSSSHTHDTDTLQEALFEIGNETSTEAGISEQPLDRDSIPYHRLPEDDRVSEAYADLGGGQPRETLAVDPPRTFAPKLPSKGASRRGGRSLPEKSGRDISREIDNAEALERAANPTLITADESRVIKAVHAALLIEKDHRLAEGNVAQELAFSATREHRKKSR